MNRRNFIKTAGLVMAGLYLRPDQWINTLYAQDARSRVVVVLNKKMRDKNGVINALEVQRTLHELLKKLFKTDSTQTALRQLIQPTDVVGIKVSAYKGEKDNATKPEVAYGLGELIAWAGFDKNKIIVWEQAKDELEGAGYKINLTNNGIRCAATFNQWRERTRDQVRQPMIGLDAQEIKIGSATTRLSNLMTKSTTFTINMPALKTHKFKDNTGVNGAILNMYGAIEITGPDPDNPKEKPGNTGVLYANECNPAAAQVYAVPAIKDKTRLVICDAIYPLYNGGPGDDSRYHWDYNGLIGGFDPVAVDMIGQEILQEYRNQRGDPNVPQLKSDYLTACGSPPYQLGNHQRFQIELIKQEI